MLDWIQNNPIISAVIGVCFALIIALTVLLILAGRRKKKTKKAYSDGENFAQEEFDKVFKDEG